MSVKKEEVGVFVWFSLETTDADKATAYYEKLLGCTAVPSPGGNHKMLRSKLDADATDEEKKSKKKGGIHFAHVEELTADQTKKGAKPRWMVWMAVEDADASAAQAEKLGGKIVTAPADIPGVGRYALVADPAGAEFNVFTPRATKTDDCDHGAPLSAMGDRPGEVTWVELNTYDLDKVVPFYEALLGWKASEPTSLMEDGAYRSITINGGKGAMVGGFFHPPSKVPKTDAAWTPYFATGDAGGVEPFQARAAELGGKICVPRTAIPDTGFFAICSDPCDALFFFFEPLPPKEGEKVKECDKKRAAEAADAAPNPASPKKTKADA